ncbi:MAG: NeuD/PglB/VioB family sugar acetyltransferase [Deltaproteobacteria bacterium]|nr:NeuD/PglB/VioB family sugar acetyltransferase [Deltaproteobacteria bacterium]
MNVYVVGAGGHAKVIVALIEARGDSVGGVFDGDVARVGSMVLGHRVQWLGDLKDREVDVVVAVGGNRARQRVVGELKGHRFAALVHPHAWVAPSARLLPGSVVFAGAVVQPDAVVGAHAIVNTAASIDHDCVLGDFVHIAPGSHLAGNVDVGEGAFLGVGVSVIPGRKIGAWATVGAGAVVVVDVSADVVVKGVPAR